MHRKWRIRHASILSLALAPLVGGCLSRPVTNTSPEAKTEVTHTATQSAVNRVDLLFMIDNSRSMGDKQQYLAAAVPDLLNRLLTPNCVDVTDATKVVGVSVDGVCSTGRIEFPPVHDMHIAVVTSALGSLGGDVCPDPSGAGGAPNVQNDYGQLVNGSNVADAPDGFLGWFPATDANAGSSPTPGTPSPASASALVSDFQGLVTGVGESGCGIEAQLESWYRFLMQPDPFQTVTASNNVATLDGVDATVLQQRHDFLRPDSLLAIIDLSDEDDSSVDPRAYSGSAVAGYHMNETDTPPFRGTAACAADPSSPDCTSCDATSAKGDPGCTNPTYDVSSDPQGEANIRHIHMKQNFGLDSQYPMSRYVNGLTAKMVPDRTGEYPDGSQTYQGNANCSNPIYSTNLPDGSDTSPGTLCNLSPGTRDPSKVFYAHIGGVPTDLLHYDPTSPAASALTTADWTKILGADPAHYDYTGIDPRMAETFKQRPVAATPASTYWDLAYACTFPLATPRDCTDGTVNAGGCDCAESTPPAGSTGWELCNPSNPTQQVAAKAYPTFRELYLANLMGPQGIVSSLCPIDITPNGANDPLYGYRPAMASIIGALTTQLAGQCFDEKLSVVDGTVQCLLLASLPAPGQACDPTKGMSAVDPQVVAETQQSLTGDPLAGRFDPTQYTICQIDQVPSNDLVGGSCVQSSAPGWCYVQGAATGTSCPQAILYSPSGQPASGVVTLTSCLEDTPGVDSDAGSGQSD
ncbi:MAG TPA: hypothetical protein VGL81_18490 [Polyangiaceae bacterium]|jgi:hypothetical protein